MEETIWITNRFGEKLEAILRKPEGAGPFPAVVFVHGLGMTLHEWNNSFDEISKYLNQAGFLTLQFQLPVFQQDGSVRELPLDVRAKHFEDAFAYLKCRSDVNSKRTGVIAQSFGVPTVMTANTSGIVTAVFISGAYNPLESIARVYTSRGAKINYQGDTTLPRTSGEHTMVGKEFWKSLQSYDEIKLAQSLTLPSLFLLHGDKDEYIKSEYLQQFYAAVAFKNKKLKIFQGGDHGLMTIPRPMREEFLNNVLNWFKKTL